VYECLSATTVTGAFDVSKWNLLFEKSNLLTMYMIDIALYHVHSRIMPQQIPKLREDRYNAAITWLEKVSEGVLSANLPLLKNADGEQESGVAKHGDRGTVSVRGSRYF
jgi:phage gp36-like protein